jgi:hypothetical protein
VLINGGVIVKISKIWRGKKDFLRKKDINKRQIHTFATTYLLSLIQRAHIDTERHTDERSRVK